MHITLKENSTFEDLVPGQSAENENVVTQEMVAAFAQITGDRNPLHMDEAYAATACFKGRIAHGALVGSFISGLVSMKMPGSMARSIHLTFKRPVMIGATVRTRVEVKSLNEKWGFANFAAACSVDGKTVIEGEIVVIPPREKKKT